jgi:Mg2+-importing ATPase
MACSRQRTTLLLKPFRHSGLLKGIVSSIATLTQRLLTQLLVVIMLRTQHIPLFRSRPAKVVSFALTVIGLIGLAIPYIPPIANALQMERPHPSFYGFLAAILFCYVLLTQVVKTIYRHIYKDWL